MWPAGVAAAAAANAEAAGPAAARPDEGGQAIQLLLHCGAFGRLGALRGGC